MLRSGRRSGAAILGGGLLLALLTGCTTASAPVHSDRASVATRVYRSCMLEAGWGQSRAIDLSAERQYLQAAAQCETAARLFAPPSLTERIRTYRAELAAARCLHGVGYDTTPPALDRYLATPADRAWNPYDEIASIPGDQSYVQRACPKPAGS